MARVNVEQKALTDPRFYRLGLELEAAPQHAQAVGVFAMIRVWNECIERGKYSLHGWALDALLGRTDVGSKITLCDLAKEMPRGLFRIKGTKGRIEYLEIQRRNGLKYGHLGAEHGKKGGRPKKPHQGVSGRGAGGIPNNPLPAPAPAPALKTKDQEPPLPPETGGTAKGRSKKSRPPKAEIAVRPRNAMFDAIAELSGSDPKTTGGRIGALAATIAAAGISPEELRERLPAVVQQFAPYRSALDLGTIKACWSWIRTPPATVEKAGPKARGQTDFEYIMRSTMDALEAP